MYQVNHLQLLVLKVVAWCWMPPVGPRNTILPGYQMLQWGHQCKLHSPSCCDWTATTVGILFGMAGLPTQLLEVFSHDSCRCGGGQGWLLPFLGWELLWKSMGPGWDCTAIYHIGLVATLGGCWSWSRLTATCGRVGSCSGVCLPGQKAGWSWSTGECQGWASSASKVNEECQHWHLPGFHLQRNLLPLWHMP